MYPSYYLGNALSRNTVVWAHVLCQKRLLTDAFNVHLQVLLLRFNFGLSEANLSSQMQDNLQDNIGQFVDQILDAVCSAYAEEDCLLLQIFCDFLTDLGNEPKHRQDLEKSVSLQFVQQIFLVLDYKEGKEQCVMILVFFGSGVNEK